ncbi:SLAM family member 9-like isoform X2 [Carassius auratus]|uniref:SLAM family member 9-like isoform X2 n=1 Tax=Carassius auratus TaxID=7957 RepID=A0A6P6JLT1_CARAU|nr:SLAM family member 9-like isoform X2 [Carassius auratus]
MIVLSYSTSFICAVFFITEAVSGEDKAVGSSVSFRPDKMVSPVSSIIWKHRNRTGVVVKAIEWDKEEPEVNIPHPRFKGITSLDEKTGQITITKLTVEHSGLYTIDINSKEQEQKFTLNVIEPVPKPKITKEESTNADGVPLKCDYSGEIIWKNSTGQTVEDKKNEITVKNTGNPENFYTCTLKNTVSEETSDRVYERELFVTGAGPITGILICIILLLLLIIILICIYLLKKSIYDRVNARCPRIESVLGYVDCCKTKREQYIITSRGDEMKNEAVSQGDEMKNEAVSQDQKDDYVNVSDATQSQNQ